MPETATYRNSLQLNSMLLEYRLESVLGAGGFGMTYLGWDTNLEKHVAIKEYLPGELAIRALDCSVMPVNTENEYNYKWGLDRFIQEARTLAKFSHPNIVRVNRFFEANGTSYMVMDYEAGESLHQYRSFPVSRTAISDQGSGLSRVPHLARDGTCGDGQDLRPQQWLWLETHGGHRRADRFSADVVAGPER